MVDYSKFIDEQVAAIKAAVGDQKAICALSGGVDSSVVAMLAYEALGTRLDVVFVENGLMRQGEIEQVVHDFGELGITVNVIDARAEFLAALAGLTDPEQKRRAITATFYAKVFAQRIRETGATVVLQGTILTDVEETVAGIKAQHNVLEQIGIIPEEEFGYKVVEPLVTLRKDGVREVARLLKLPPSISERIPFPGPALAARIIGEVTQERLDTVRQATAIVEVELVDSGAFQYFAILSGDRATGIVGNERRFGQVLVVRCINSIDARTAQPTRLDWDKLSRLSQRLTDEVPDVSRVVYDITPKPPSTVEWI